MIEIVDRGAHRVKPMLNRVNRTVVLLVRADMIAAIGVAAALLIWMAVR